MSFATIKQKIKEKLGTINSIQEVADYPNEEFQGFPAVMIASARNEGEFETTTENKRTYVFKVFVLQKCDAEMGEQKARNIVDGVVDDIIEAFDEDQQLSGISLPAQEMMIICSPMLGEVRSEPPYIVGELEIKILISFSIT